MAASCQDSGSLLYADGVIERLIEAVKKYPCVYDTNRLEYRDASRKENAWRAIRTDCGLTTVEECLKLWKRLRDRYTREMKVLEMYKRCGSDSIAKRTSEFTRAMEFYKDCGRPRKTASNLALRSPLDESGINEELSSGTTEIFNTTVESPSHPSPIDPAERKPDVWNPPLGSLSRQETQNGRKAAGSKRKNNDSFEVKLFSKRDKRMTENEAFGLSVGMALDRWSVQQASLCKLKIMEIIVGFDAQ